jgi:hypothetical protein
MKVSSTRSVGMNLARRFNAGGSGGSCSRRVATIDFIFSFSRRYATRTPH